jgi:hypothetical protein
VQEVWGRAIIIGLRREGKLWRSYGVRTFVLSRICVQPSWVRDCSLEVSADRNLHLLCIHQRGFSNRTCTMDVPSPQNVPRGPHDEDDHSASAREPMLNIMQNNEYEFLRMICGWSKFEEGPDRLSSGAQSPSSEPRVSSFYPASHANQPETSPDSYRMGTSASEYPSTGSIDAYNGFDEFDLSDVSHLLESFWPVVPSEGGVTASDDTLGKSTIGVSKMRDIARIARPGEQLTKKKKQKEVPCVAAAELTLWVTSNVLRRAMDEQYRAPYLYIGRGGVGELLPQLPMNIPLPLSHYQLPVDLPLLLRRSIPCAVIRRHITLLSSWAALIGKACPSRKDKSPNGPRLLRRPGESVAACGERRVTEIEETSPVNSEDDDCQKKRSDTSSPDRLPSRRLKCPFYQRQPEKHTRGSCRGPGFTDMGKLKDHIKRVHTQPLRCVRCWLSMDTEAAYDEHLQQGCEMTCKPHDDRIRPHVLKQLDFKKAPYTKARNVEEKWRLLFKELFPDETEIPSPCKSTSCGVLLAQLTAADEDEAMSPSLVKALSKALEKVLSRELAHVFSPNMSRIEALVPSIVQSCRIELMRASPPFTGSSHQGSSDGDLWSHDTPATSPCSASSCEIVAPPERRASTASGKGARRIAVLRKPRPSTRLPDTSNFYPNSPVPAPPVPATPVPAPPAYSYASRSQDIDTFFSTGYNTLSALNPSDHQSNVSPVTMCMNVSSNPALACGDMHCMFCKTIWEEGLPPVWDPLTDSFDFENFCKM